LCDELRTAGLTCEVREDEVTMLWSKLCFLAPFALATTASGGPLGLVRSDPGWWARLEECVDEACAVAVAEGGGSLSLMPSWDPSSVVVASTASTCQ
jgi:2-dehydropantoate 2-reductase